MTEIKQDFLLAAGFSCYDNRLHWWQFQKRINKRNIRISRCNYGYGDYEQSWYYFESSLSSCKGVPIKTCGDVMLIITLLKLEII